jgi:hypothetical protein
MLCTLLASRPGFDSLSFRSVFARFLPLSLGFLSSSLSRCADNQLAEDFCSAEGVPAAAKHRQPIIGLTSPVIYAGGRFPADFPAPCSSSFLSFLSLHRRFNRFDSQTEPLKASLVDVLEQVPLEPFLDLDAYSQHHSPICLQHASEYLPANSFSVLSRLRCLDLDVFRGLFGWLHCKFRRFCTQHNPTQGDVPSFDFKVDGKKKQFALANCVRVAILEPAEKKEVGSASTRTMEVLTLPFPLLFPLPSPRRRASSLDWVWTATRNTSSTSSLPVVTGPLLRRRPETVD